MKLDLNRFSKSDFSKSQIRLLITGVFFLGFMLRIGLVFSSTNFDFESYKITSALVLDGTPPWQSQRYNYGITWSLILSGLQLLSFNSDFIFRLLIIIVLSLADLSISLTLKSWFGYKTALIFFLNPVSIIITGHYNQFDNLSISVGLLALVLLNRFQDNPKFKYLLGTILLFSLSFTIKHNLVLFLLWFIFSSFSKRIKLSLIAVPCSLFLLHFLPFMLISLQDRESILSAVFKYWSSNNAPFWKFWFWDKGFAESLGDHTAWHHGRLWMILMLLAVTTVGYFSRREPLEKQLAIFTISLIIFASAITSQFLAIAAVGAAVFYNKGFALFFLFGSLCLFADPAGFNSEFLRTFLDLRNWNSWNTAPALLLIGVFVQLFISRFSIRVILSNMVNKVKRRK